MGEVVVYTDGSGLASRGPGGAAYVAIIGSTISEGSLEIPAATNQIAELVAAAFGLEAIPPSESVRLYSDSEYVVKGMNEWVTAWIDRGWRTAGGSAVRNQEHWERLLAAAARHRVVVFRWLRGHNGHEWNERADVLAGKARRRAERSRLNEGAAAHG